MYGKFVFKYDILNISNYFLPLIIYLKQVIIYKHLLLQKINALWNFRSLVCCK